MFLKDKYKLGVFERIKARLVAGGDYVSRLDAGETASPTVNPTTRRKMAKQSQGEDREGHMDMELSEDMGGTPRASQGNNMNQRHKCASFEPMDGDLYVYNIEVRLGVHVVDLLVCWKRKKKLVLLRLGADTSERESQDGDYMICVGSCDESRKEHRKETVEALAEDIDQHQGEDGAEEGDASHTEASQVHTKGGCRKTYRALEYVDKSGSHVVHSLMEHDITTTFTDTSLGLHDNGEGQVSVLMTLIPGYVHMRRSKIKTTTLSSTESGQVAPCEATTYAKRDRTMLLNLSYERRKPQWSSIGQQAFHLTDGDQRSYVNRKRSRTRRSIAFEGVRKKESVLSRIDIVIVTLNTWTEVRDTGVPNEDRDRERILYIQMGILSFKFLFLFIVLSSYLFHKT
jgi:hypothetical protein